MKKVILILLLLIGTTVEAQNFEKLWSQYEKQCNELVNDTVTQYGVVSYVIINTDGLTAKFKQNTNSDTVWNEFKCRRWKNYYGIGYISKYHDQTDYLVEFGDYNELVSQKRICHIKKEKPSFEGFIMWIKNRQK